MKVFAISDLHLSFQTDKPMDLFGDHWTNYEQRIMDDWNSRVGDDDIGIIAGDISWAMRMEETEKDFAYLKKLRGQKIIIRGNHDYWWKSISKIRETLAPDTYALQNDSIQIGNIVFAGTRGWKVPERRQTQSDEDKKIYNREVIRFELALKEARARCGSAYLTEPSGNTATNAEQSSGPASCTRLVAILHYPPFNATGDDSPFTALCEKYGVTACVYGHLHGKQGRTQLHVQKNGVSYYLTSCDLLNHTLVEIKL
ncbi:MAG: metallophosphoesterase [Christensenellaceae bacterium]|jgi:predicted phosphohydrolase|nr:metallophosphoesterase [Christensenellaceae bacterium]